MRILIAYDGSDASNLVFEDLQRAGLPNQAEALIITVAEPRITGIATKDNTPSAIHGASQAAQEIADRPVKKLSALFPSWKVQAEGTSGSPVRKILERAREWDSDLIALSAIGHSALERILIGSVSYKVANEAHCSVRIVRGRTPHLGVPIIIVIGYDDLPAVRRGVSLVANRTWPAGTTVLLHTAVGFGNSPVAELVRPEERPLVETALEPSAKILRDAGLRVLTSVAEDDPKNSIVSEAERMAADCIFIGDNDESVFDRWLLGTVASAVVPRARCSVEIFR